MFRPLSGPGSAPTGSLGETLVRNDNIDGKKSEFSPVFVIFLLVEKQTVRYDQRLRVNGGYQHGCVSCVGCTCRSWSGGVYERKEFKPVKKTRAIEGGTKLCRVHYTGVRRPPLLVIGGLRVALVRISNLTVD